MSKWLEKGSIAFFFIVGTNPDNFLDSNNEFVTAVGSLDECAALNAKKYYISRFIGEYWRNDEEWQSRYKTRLVICLSLISTNQETAEKKLVEKLKEIAGCEQTLAVKAHKLVPAIENYKNKFHVKVD